MPNDKNEKHLVVYEDRYELHQSGETTVFPVGPQNRETQLRYKHIKTALSQGFLEEKYKTVSQVDFSRLSEENQRLLRNMVDGITSEVGRALVGLAFLQLTVKSIAPDQNIRLHKGTTRRGSFSWVEGISMRTIDSTYNTPFLREHGLLNLNSYGLFMTRSLAENYPYTSLYKAEMRGPFDDWIAIVDAIEDNTMPPEPGLSFLMALLQNRSDRFRQMADQACALVGRHRGDDFSAVQRLLVSFVHSTDYSARAFEVTMHGLFQAMDELHFLGGADVVPLSQMRSANKKHGNVGDIELTADNVIFESWDAKYGKPYLRDELEELRDKLLTHPDCKIAGFVADSAVDLRRGIISRKNEIEAETSTEIHLLSFDQWVEHEVAPLTGEQKNMLGRRWLAAVVESFAQRRPQLAPIDEPCDAWLRDLTKILGRGPA